MTETILAETANATIADCAPPLTAKLAPWMQKLAGNFTAANTLLGQDGLAVHAVVTSEFHRNVASLTSALQTRKLHGGLYFARKANKLPWFVQQAKIAGIGVDTASFTELEETLALGVPARDIIVTAVGKTRALLTLAIQSGCLLVIENLDELQMTLAVAQSLKTVARIGLRFSGFHHAGQLIFSRFGFPLSDAGQLLEEISKSRLLNLEVLHAHLDRYDPDQRASAVRELLNIADRAAQLNHKVTAVDIGGGIVMRYLQSENEWNHFQQSVTDAIAGKRRTFTWQADGFGLSLVGQHVEGKLDLYPAWNDLSKERFVGAILDNNASGTPLHKEINGRGLKICFEPGRALVDNTAVTLAPVLFRKRDTAGNLLVGLGMNRTNLRPFRAEFCVDPLHITLPGSEVKAPVLEGFYLVGNLCSESDVIMRRKLQLAAIPQPGDILLFPNTGGYLAHHMEIGTHGGPLPKNLLLNESSFEILATV